MGAQGSQKHGQLASPDRQDGVHLDYYCGRHESGPLQEDPSARRLSCLFSQVNGDLDDGFLGRAGSASLPKQRFMITWSYYRTVVRLTGASVPAKRSLP
jgi:hypothetical protein